MLPMDVLQTLSPLELRGLRNYLVHRAVKHSFPRLMRTYIALMPLIQVRVPS